MKRWGKQFWRIRRVRLVTAVILVLLLAAGGTAFAYADAIGNVIGQLSGSLSSMVNGSDSEAAQEFEADMQEQEELAEQEQEEAAANVVIAEPVKQKLNAGGKALEAGYRNVMAEKAVPATQQSKLEAYLINYENPEPVLILFDYLHDNFFTFDDLDQALARYGAGEPIENILQSYIDIQDQIQPRDYPHEEIERLVTTPGLSVEDIMIAEILDAHGSAPFYDIINARIAGEDWETLAARYNIINGSAKVQSVTVSASEVQECSEATGLSQEQAYERVVDAKKADIESDKIVEFVQSGKSMGVAMKEKAEKSLQAE